MKEHKIESLQNQDLDFFGRYLTIWVALCIVIGVGIGQILPVVSSNFEPLRIRSRIYSSCSTNLVNDLSYDVKN